MKNLELSVKLGVLIELQTTTTATAIIADIIKEIHLLESEIERLRFEKSQGLVD